MQVKGYCHEIKISEALRQLHFKVKFWIGVVQYNNLAQLAMCPYFLSLSSEYLSQHFIYLDRNYLCQPIRIPASIASWILIG